MAPVTYVLARCTAAGMSSRSTALLLTGFAAVVEQVAETLQPHRLCTYLYDVATALSAFYEQCPVLTSEGDTRASRIALCAAVSRCCCWASSRWKPGYRRGCWRSCPAIRRG